LQPIATANLDLASRIERGAALVITSNGIGSGFFVAPDKLVTNRHVLEGAARVLVAGKHIGVIPAEVVASGGADGFADFAVLRVEAQQGVIPFVLAMPTRVLTPVAAAGFPGLHLSTDPIFERLKQGDASAAAELSPVVTTGLINHLQRFD
jgi:S1-C subfamily serine protease